jgi:hypothetical protein
VMRRYTLLMVGLAACLAAGTVQGGQGGQGGGRGRGGDTLTLLRLPAPLAEKLQLTADQKTKFQAIQEKLRTDSEAARQSAGGDRQAAAQKTRELNMKATAEAVALLNADQKKTWEAWRADYMGMAGLGRSGVALLMVSGLSDEQKGKLKTLATDTQTKRRALPEGAPSREARMKLETETQTAVKGLLNADQVKQFDAGLAALPGRRPNQN